jgi:arylsulfatase A-like enzyme
MRVVYLDLDTLRPDHMGCYGYHRDTTPNVDRIAQEGVRFRRAYASSTPCVPSRASLLSGRFGVQHGVLTHWGPGSEFRFPAQDGTYRQDVPLLSRWLQQHGYKTVSFSSFVDRHQASWFAAGWSEFHSHTLKQGLETASEVNAAVIPWLRAHGREDDYFLHLHYWDAHRPFRMSPEWAEMFSDSPPPEWPDEAAIQSHQDNTGPFTARELFPFDERSPVPTMPEAIANRADFAHLVNGYDGAIRYLDDQLGQIFDALADLGVMDDTAIIVSSDHGEAMGEHGVYADHVCAGEEVHRIPMIIRWPGMGAVDRDYEGLCYNVDLPPTLCDLLGLPTPPGWVGQSFGEAVRGEDWQGWPYLVWDHGLYSCQRAVRTPDRLYIRTYHPGLFPFPRRMLFDPEKDPYSTVNLIEEQPDVAAAMEATMQDWLDEQIGHSGEPDPLRQIVRSGPWKYVKIDPWLARLRSKGREDAAAKICQRLGLA